MCFGFNACRFFPLLQLDLTSAQLLVTDNDFRDKDFRNQLSETVKSLLALKVIPIFNENDAVSTRKAPYEVRYHSLPALLLVWEYIFLRCTVLHHYYCLEVAVCIRSHSA